MELKELKTIRAYVETLMEDYTRDADENTEPATADLMYLIAEQLEAAADALEDAIDSIDDLQTDNYWIY